MAPKMPPYPDEMSEDEFREWILDEADAADRYYDELRDRQMTEAPREKEVDDGA